MKVSGRYGSFRPKAHQAAVYGERAKREARQQREAAGSLQAWLERHKTCANGCGKPVAFYDTTHYALRFGGCCSAECEREKEEQDRMREVLTFWAVRVDGARTVAGSDFTAATMGEVFLSPTTKLAGWAKYAMLDSHALAQEFANALRDRISKRQGKAVELHVVEIQVGGSAKMQEGHRAKIAAHSAEVRERLRRGAFAPNVRVLDAKS